jgi:alkanesulfonate monooxygenase SsuD/methylene tetrahydromethanopterin reductase-like flavin-dependent oxidoreductase (luciferase family)
MKIGLVQDGALTEGADPLKRMEEVIEEAVLAEEMGFDFYGLSEVHFSPEMTISAPEVLLGAIAAKTDRMRLRTVSTPMLTFNHPVRVAERVATLDLVSNGRMELGTARSNQAHTIEAFEVDVNETRQQYSEGIEIAIKALSQETFSHEGPVWNIPERSLYPKPIQKPHPPVFASATSKETHEYAGREGLGIMSGNSLAGGWEFVQECVDLYRSSWVDGAERGRLTNSTFSSLALRAHCAETSEKALEEAGAAAFDTVDMVMRWFTKLAKKSDDYAYMASIEELVDHQRDLQYLVDRAPYITIGDPDLFVERSQRLESMGVDEFILEIDGIGHEKQMSAIELIGKEVIPKVGSGAKEAA